MRAASRCLCPDLPSVPTRTQLLILQHPRERFHPFGTARLVQLAIPATRVEVTLGGFAGDMHHPVPVPADAAVLFPHPQALDLAALPAAERPSTLVVLDGTWPNARKVYRANPWLWPLRHVRIHPDAPSRYRIRKEPRADYLSTIEAVTVALRILEPDNAALDALLTLFDRMVERQLACLAALGPDGLKPRPPKIRRRAPKWPEPPLSTRNLP